MNRGDEGERGIYRKTSRESNKQTDGQAHTQKCRLQTLRDEAKKKKKKEREREEDRKPIDGM